MNNEAIKIRAGIIGAAGYTGGEIIRLLLHHPGAEIVFAHSRSNAGKPVHAVHTDLLGETDLVFTSDLNTDVDVLFLCLGHGESRIFLHAVDIPAPVKIIDLSQDFRLAANASPGNRHFVYGLPEAFRSSVQAAAHVANPGCFATAIQLGLLPLAQAGLLNAVHTTGITGATGAGQKLQSTSHFSWRAQNVQAYKSLTHQHLGEINQTLSMLQPGFQELYFIPWRGDFPRGIYVTSYTTCALPLDEAYRLYHNYYAPHPFTQVYDTPIDMKQVVNTNKCALYLEKAGDQLIIHSAIDNLLKGASGQAVQNMNLMFELDETAGLKLKSIVF